MYLMSDFRLTSIEYLEQRPRDQIVEGVKRLVIGVKRLVIFADIAAWDRDLKVKDNRWCKEHRKLTKIASRD